MELSQVAVLLQEYECYCYRIAYFLLEREDGAILAAKQALLELGRNRLFLTGSAEQRRITAKKAAVKHSLLIRA